MNEPTELQWQIFWERIFSEICKCLTPNKEAWIARTTFGCSTMEWLEYKIKNEVVGARLGTLRGAIVPVEFRECYNSNNIKDVE